MLVLTRRVGQTIRINDDITVMLVEVRGENARIGVEAPRIHAIHRDEIYQKCKAIPLGEPLPGAKPSKVATLQETIKGLQERIVDLETQLYVTGVRI